MSNDLVIDVVDEDGIIITDKNQDRCYIYFTEIPELIKKLTSIRNDGVSP